VPLDKLQRKGLSRLMAYCLARRPDEFGLVPDAQGFIPLKQLARALAEEPGWGFVREAFLREAAWDGPFEISEDGRIRSTDQAWLPNFFREPGGPLPALLYHAARRRAYAAIFGEQGVARPEAEGGLAGAEGRPVVLAATPELAYRIGRRRDSEPVPITVRAAEAARAGVPLTLAGELLYLAPAVPARFLSGPPAQKVPPPPRRPQPKAEAEPVAQEMPGSFFPRLTPPAPPEPGTVRRARRSREEPDWKRDRRRGKRKGPPEGD
jgi:putative RNA 2'-phosphotransferase